MQYMKRVGYLVAAVGTSDGCTPPSLGLSFAVAQLSSAVAVAVAVAAGDPAGVLLP
jgi:hypothetical protein